MARILVVDDDSLMRAMLTAKLRKLGHEVTAAGDGREAMNNFAATPSDLVFTDLVMPEQEGLETIRELRRLYPDVRIVAMSGGGRGNAGDYLRIARILGAVHVLAKPFNDEALREALKVALAAG